MSKHELLKGSEGFYSLPFFRSGSLGRMAYLVS